MQKNLQRQQSSLSCQEAFSTGCYGSPNPTFTGTLAGVQNNDNISALYATAATPASDVGGYAITPTLIDPDGRLGNYSVTVQNGSLTITPATLTVTANPQTKVCGSPDPALTYAVSGFQLSDTAARRC
jgi:hypothetical protein